MRAALLAGLVIPASCAEQRAPSDSASADTVAAIGALASDTLSGLAAGIVDTTPTAPVPSPNTTPPTPKPNELDALAATMIIPVQSVVAIQLRDNYTEERSGHTHEALDIHAPRGTPVLAATDGKVTKLYISVAGGTMVYAADATDRFVFMYGHLDRYADGLTEGMPLERGQIIGYVGTTGNAPPGTPHLHFAVARGRPSIAWWKGTPVNPYSLFVPHR